MRLSLLTLVLMGCPFVTQSDFETSIQDVDGDGFVALRFGGQDCDDTNANVFPGANEVWYDGLDQNCDGRDDFDQDGDGFNRDDDCDDLQARVNPSATELCDGFDNDCDGLTDDADLIDEANLPEHFVDQDGDGFGSLVSFRSCVAPANTVAISDDCNDLDETVNPAADEFCDATDRNCDGSPDDGALDRVIVYADLDGDGFGDAGASVPTCAPIAGHVDDSTDCDDEDAMAHPGPNGETHEICDGGVDNDCNGTADDGDTGLDRATTLSHYADGDSDGFGRGTAARSCVVPAGRAPLNGDCNDGVATIHPARPEICDGIDNDCDGEIDVSAVDAATYFIDADGDGFGSATEVLSCAASPSGVVLNSDDCDDTNPRIRPGGLEICGDDILQDCNVTLDDCDGDGSVDADDCADENPAIHPAATEICDGLDNDCDGDIDANDTDTVIQDVDYFLDDDGDGFGTNIPLVVTAACVAPPRGVTAVGDCDDTQASVHPGSLERCDGLDNDCNGAIDDGQPSDPPTYYLDSDADGYGDSSLPYALTCEAPGPNWVTNRGDCDESNPSRNPGVDETCGNGIDEDCDNRIDSADNDAVPITWYRDFDQDGLGVPLNPVLSCEQPVGYSAISGDCDDANPDTAGNGLQLWLDNDGDGYGLIGSTPIEWCGPAPLGYAANNQDCNDAEARVQPNALEICDGIDNNCDSLIDVGPGLIGFPGFRDSDGDSYGNAADVEPVCQSTMAMLGRVLIAGDCDDTEEEIFPGAPEVCGDGVDNDCNGQIDDGGPLYAPDLDNDGFLNLGLALRTCMPPPLWKLAAGQTDVDCDDNNAQRHPNLVETCDGLDNNCNALVDDGLPTHQYFADADQDGVFGSVSSTPTCQSPAPAGFSEQAGLDCDDSRASVKPGAPELCDDLDNNCDGEVDERLAAGFGIELRFRDVDGDGFGDAAEGAFYCRTASPTPGRVSNPDDCDDTEILANPDVLLEDCSTPYDDNCLPRETDVADGLVTNGTAVVLDADGDGHGVSTSQACPLELPSGWYTDGRPVDDCNDALALVFLGAIESCNDVDDDCDGDIDNVASGTPRSEVRYFDLDGDGYGDPLVSQSFCRTAPADFWLRDDTDCDDDEVAANPGMLLERCDTPFDDNCRNDLDDVVGGLFGSTTTTLVFKDADDDGFTTGIPYRACPDGIPTGWTSQNLPIGDCDDGNSNIKPFALEACDGVDNDCDGVIDEVSTFLGRWYFDDDGDGYGGDVEILEQRCTPIGVENSDDCDDTRASVNPGVTFENCDTTYDDNCRGPEFDLQVQVLLGSTNKEEVWVDRDGDGFYDNDTSTLCSEDVPLAGSLVSTTMPTTFDCDDRSNAIVGPSIAVYPDLDFDGFGNEEEGVQYVCFQQPGLSTNNLDCNDGVAVIHPNAQEDCNTNDDDDCDGSIFTARNGFNNGNPYYLDADGDGMGAGLPVQFCGMPPTTPTYVTSTGDCNDDPLRGGALVKRASTPIIRSGSTSLAALVDAACDGQIIQNTGVANLTAPLIINRPMTIRGGIVQGATIEVTTEDTVFFDNVIFQKSTQSVGLRAQGFVDLKRSTFLGFNGPNDAALRVTNESLVFGDDLLFSSNTTAASVEIGGAFDLANSELEGNELGIDNKGQTWMSSVMGFGGTTLANHGTATLSDVTFEAEEFAITQSAGSVEILFSDFTTHSPTSTSILIQSGDLDMQQSKVRAEHIALGLQGGTSTLDAVEVSSDMTVIEMTGGDLTFTDGSIKSRGSLGVVGLSVSNGSSFVTLDGIVADNLGDVVRALQVGTLTVRNSNLYLEPSHTGIFIGTGHLQLEDSLVKGGSVGVSVKSSTSTLLRSRLLGSQTAATVTSNAALTLSQTLLAPISLGFEGIGSGSTVVMNNVTMVGGQALPMGIYAPTQMPSTITVQANRTLFLGKFTPLSTISGVNNLRENASPTSNATQVPAGIIPSELFRYGDTGCTDPETWEIQPLTSAFKIGNDVIGWTGPTDPQSWLVSDNGLPIGYRTRFSYTGDPMFDTDGDTLNGLDELMRGTDAGMKDTDGDGSNGYFDDNVDACPYDPYIQ